MVSEILATPYPNNDFSDQRKEQSDKIRLQYPDRIPIICEKAASSKLPDIDKNKYRNSV